MNDNRVVFFVFVIIICKYNMYLIIFFNFFYFSCFEYIKFNINTNDKLLVLLLLVFACFQCANL